MNVESLFEEVENRFGTNATCIQKERFGDFLKFGVWIQDTEVFEVDAVFTEGGWVIATYHCPSLMDIILGQINRRYSYA